MPIELFVLIVILGVVLVVLVWFYVRLFTKPQKINQIKEMMAEGNVEPAITELQRLIEKNSFDHEAHKLLGDAYYRVDNRKLAIMQYRIAEKNVDNMPAEWEIDIHKKLSDILYRSEEYKDALQELLLLNKLNSRDVQCLFRIGEIYSMHAQYDRAIHYFRMVLKLDSSHAAAYSMLGKALYEIQDYGNALTELSNAVKYKEDDYDASYTMGLCYKNMNDLGRAIDCFSISERDRRIRGKVLVNKGICFVQMGSIDIAIEEYKKGLNLRDLSSNVRQNIHYFLAEALELKNNIPEAIEHWEIINKQNPGFKNVGKKLEQYRDLRHSDLIKDYMTSAPQQFQSICIVAMEKMGFTLHEARTLGKNEITMIAREVSKMVATKPLMKLMVFSRINSVVNESRVRDAVDEMKRTNCNICIFISTSNFSTTAKEYAQTRPVQLIDAKQLTTIFAKGT